MSSAAHSVSAPCTEGAVSGGKRRRVEVDSEHDSTEPESIVITEANRDFQTGNIRLISSDGLVFKCRARQLWPSQVLGDMMEKNASGSDSEHTRFFDESLEYGWIIAMFLDSSQGGMWARLDDHDVEDIYAFAAFLKKWDCPSLIELLKTHLRPVIPDFDGSDAEEDYDDKNWFDHIIFAVGAILGDVDLCYAGIRHGCRKTWRSDDKAFMGDLCNSTPSLDLRGASQQYLDLIPQDYCRALLRAQIGRDLSEGSLDWKLVAKEFRRLMRGPKPSAL